MSAQVIELPVRQRGGAPELRPLIRGLIDRMASELGQYPGYEALPGGLAFDNRVGRTTVGFRGVEPASIDGRKLCELAEVRTELQEDFQEFSGQILAHFNSMASLGAVLREPDTGRVVVYTRCPIYVGDDDVLGHYGLLLHAAAMAHDDQVIAGVCAGTGREVPEHLIRPIRGAGVPAPWGLEDFAAWAARLHQLRLPATASAESLMASLPWPADTGFPACGERSGILLLLDTRIPHPVLGSGLHCRLELPVAVEEAAGVELVNRLNLIERRSLAAGPGFGAWCPVPGAPRLAWVSFLPDMPKPPGLLDTLVAGMLLRAQRVGWMIRGGERWPQCT